MCFPFDTIIWSINFELFLLFVFVLFLCTMNFLGNVLYLDNIRPFRKLLTHSSSTAIPEEEAESAIEEDFRLIVPMDSKKMNDLNQKNFLHSSKHRMLFNNIRINEITVCSCQVSQVLQSQSATL